MTTLQKNYRKPTVRTKLKNRITSIVFLKKKLITFYLPTPYFFVWVGIHILPNYLSKITFLDTQKHEKHSNRYKSHLMHGHCLAVKVKNLDKDSRKFHSSLQETVTVLPAQVCLLASGSRRAQL